MDLPIEAGTAATVNTQAVTQTTTQTDTIRVQLTPANQNRIQRIVGYLEYSQALEKLTQLTSLCSLEELGVIDEIIASEPEFTVYTNLSRRIAPNKTLLLEQPLHDGDTFARQGLRWMIGLAQTELAAMLVGFADHSTPFRAVAGPAPHSSEFKELLIDGARMHVRSLLRDDDFKRHLKRGSVNAYTLTCVRRLNLAGAFLGAAMDEIQTEINEPQREELKGYAQFLVVARESLRARIQERLDTPTVRSKDETQELLEVCVQSVCQRYPIPGSE